MIGQARNEPTPSVADPETSRNWDGKVERWQRDGIYIRVRTTMYCLHCQHTYTPRVVCLTGFAECMATVNIKLEICVPAQKVKK